MVVVAVAVVVAVVVTLTSLPWAYTGVRLCPLASCCSFQNQNAVVSQSFAVAAVVAAAVAFATWFCC